MCDVIFVYIFDACHTLVMVKYALQMHVPCPRPGDLDELLDGSKKTS